MPHHDEACATHADTSACSLPPGALPDRIEQWQSLVVQALSRESGEGWVRSTYANVPAVSRRLAQLIDAEKECCAFLVFDVKERGSRLEVELRYPPEFAPMLAAITS